MKTYKKIAPIVVLAILAALITMWFGSMGVAARGTFSSSPPPPSEFPNATPLPTAAPYEDGNYACWQACIAEYPDRVEGWCLCVCGIEDNGTCYVQGQVPGSDEFLPPPPRPAPTSTPTPVSVVAGEFVGTWWKNEVTECNLYSDGYRIVRIQCERCIEDLLNEGYW